MLETKPRRSDLEKETRVAELLLAYDIGRTGTRVAIFDRKITCLASAYAEYQTYYSKPGWIEQAPNEWWQAVVESTHTLLMENEVNPAEISAISLCGQMMAQVPVGVDGGLLQGRVGIWSDSRAVAQAERVIEGLGGYQRFYEITLQGYNPATYPLFRAMWYMENLPDVFSRTHKLLHSKEYIAYRLSGAFATDFTDQAVSCTLDMRNRTWSSEMFETAKIPRGLFPELHESTDTIGKLTKESASALGLVEGTPVVIGTGAGPAKVAAAGAVESGDAVVEFGPDCWCSLVQNRPIGDSDVGVTVYNHLVPGLSYPQLTLPTGLMGELWAMNNMFGGIKGTDVHQFPSDLASSIPMEEDTVLFVPTIRGRNAWPTSSTARGAFLGIGENHTREHLLRAVQEAIAFQIREALDRLADMAENDIPVVKVIGPRSRNAYWVQMLADVTGRSIATIDESEEANCLAAAVCAGVGIGMFDDFSEIKRVTKVENKYEPDGSIIDFYGAKYEIFLEAARGIKKVEEVATAWESGVN